jgi:hypothetical protein
LRTNGLEPDGYGRWLPIRRSVTGPTEVAYFACGGPPATTLRQLVPVAGVRWATEDLFEMGKGECGLDGYEVRGWTGWHRHVTLSLWAAPAFRSATCPASGGRCTSGCGGGCTREGCGGSSRP